MNTAKIKQTNIRHSSAKKHAISSGNSFKAQVKDQMCPPAKKTGFVKVDERKGKIRNGGYVQVQYGVPVAERIPDANAGASSYSDFILYNYGSESERYYASEPGNES